MAKNSKRIVWPVYMDAHKTRKEGRILAKKDSLGAPDIDEIMRAAKELGLNPSCEDEKMYPRSWWERKGRVRPLRSHQDRGYIFSSSQEGFSPNSLAARMISSMSGAPNESFFAKIRPSLRVLCASMYTGQTILFEFFAIV